MTLEEQIDSRLGDEWYSIVFWTAALRAGEQFIETGYAEGDVLCEVNQLIQSATLAECLTSPSEYIREYRKLYELGSYR